MPDEPTSVVARARKKPHRHKDTDGGGASATPADDRRPVIQVVAGALHQLASQAEDALIAAGVPFYARGGEIVRPIVDQVPTFRGGKTKVTRLRAITEDMMRDQLSRVARWERYDGRAKKLVATDPPKDVAKTILSRDGDWRLRRLAGVITTPTLRPDGSILAEPGYDPTTRLLLLEPPPMPAIPERPGRDAALAALVLLELLLDEFPFVTDADRSVALSALMTPVVRGAMQVAPLHAMTAPEAGTGKSYLIDIASAIATGEKAPVIAAGRNEEETEKRLGAELMTAQPIVSIDNLNGELAGDFLCQAIERPVVKPRVLGLSKNMRIQNTVCLFVNGNNIRLVGDVVRRVVLCSMDANMERPELRRFASDPVAAVLADRGRYVAAALTVARAYLAAGCPDLCDPLASFEDWSRLVRSPLVWLGRADPVATMEAARADDPSRANLRAVAAAWNAAVGPNKPLTAGELRDAAGNSADPDVALRKALLAVAPAVPRRDEIDAAKLGLYLRRNRGRVIDGLKISGEQDKHLKQLKWWLARSR
jgi:putative DNA primase/helicase